MSKKPRGPLVILFLTVFIDLIGFGMIIPLIPSLGRELSDSPFKAGLLMAIYSLMQFFINPIWGQISDRVGRRPILLLSLAGAGLSHLAFSFGSSFLILFLARLFAGVFGANISVAMAAMADLSDEKSRSVNMGLIGAAFGLGFTLGPFFGGALGHLGSQISLSAPLGVQTAALGASIICGLNFVFAFFRLPETNKNLGQANTSRSLKNKFNGLFRYLKIPVTRELLTTYGLNTLAMALIEVSLFLFVKDRFQLSLIQASFGFAYIGLILVFTQGYLIRILIPKLGETKLIFIGLILFIMGNILVASSFTLYVLGLAVSLIGFGQGFLSPSLTGSLSLSESAKHQGQIMGVTQSLSALGRIIGPLIAGAIYLSTDFVGPFYLSALLAGFALLIMLTSFSKLPQRAL